MAKQYNIPNLPKDYSDASQIEKWMSGIQKLFQSKSDADNKKEKEIEDSRFPVGSWYVQYPSAKSNDEDTAFPPSLYPSELFGGTWTEMFDDEGIFFRTKGEFETRTNGLQMDAMQRIKGDTGCGWAAFDTGSGVFTPYSGGKHYDHATDYNVHGAYFDSANSTTPNVVKSSDTETRGKNRLKKVWYREA